MSHIIKNFDTLASTPHRDIALQLVESALTSIQPSHVMNKHFTLDGNTLTILDKSYDLTQYDRIHLVGFGKGSSGISKYI